MAVVVPVVCWSKPSQHFADMTEKSDEEGSDFSFSSDSEDEDEDGEEKKQEQEVAAVPADSSDDEEADRCPICLLRYDYSGYDHNHETGSLRLRLQPVGRPEGCQHTFCLCCILEWAKVASSSSSVCHNVLQVTPSCPIDRATISLIKVRDSLESPESGSVPVAKKKKAEEVIPVEEEDVTQCEVCQLGDREHLLLLCDGCDLGHHTTCLDPPLQEVRHHILLSRI